MEMSRVRRLVTRRPAAGAERTRDDQDAREADQCGQQPCARQAFAEDEGRGQRNDQRGGEFQREHLRERDKGDGEQPEVLRGEMHDVAQKLDGQKPRRDVAQLAGNGGNAKDDDQPDEGPPEHHLVGVEGRADLARGDGDTGEPGDAARHPQCCGQRAVHRRGPGLWLRHAITPGTGR